MELDIDHLTGLLNQSALERRVESGEPFTGVVAVCDVDNFKSVNDQYGHLVGDEILRNIGHLLRSSVRQEDEAYRWGGDEFVILFQNQHLSMVRSRIHEIRQQLNDFRVRGYGVLPISLSWGAAEAHGAPLRPLLDAADHDMYSHKKRRSASPVMPVDDFVPAGEFEGVYVPAIDERSLRGQSTKKFRRAIFFARYEAGQFGSPFIETKHLLLGLLRADKALANRFLRSHAAVESIRKQIEGHTTIREKLSTSVDLPLSDECKRVLAYGAEEAERLSQKHIGTEHLLLGLLREEKCFAAEILHGYGLRPSTIREELARPASPESDHPGER